VLSYHHLYSESELPHPSHLQQTEQAAGNPLARLITGLKLEHNKFTMRLRDPEVDSDDEDDEEEEKSQDDQVVDRRRGSRWSGVAIIC